MDHKGPEHHYNELECPGCGAFFQQGEVQPETVRNNCPECDYDLRSSTGGRPYRDQPAPINSEMTERNTPLDGASGDRGGNPLGEGILAGLKDKMDWEEIAELDEATEPAGLGETHPVKDNQWKPGDKGSPMGRDEILGSVHNSGEHSWSDPGDNDNQDLWDQVVEDFENAQAEPHQLTNRVATASWLDEEPDNFPVEQLGWDIVDIVEPSKELTEAANKYSMPMPEGITDNLHEALIALNAWVENPEENGKLRPYKEYWSVIRPKITQGSVQIGVEDPHMADIINDVVRTNNLSALDKTSSMNKQSWSLALRALPMVLGEGAEIGSIGGVMKGALGAGRAVQGINGLAQGASDLLGGGDQQQQPQMQQDASDFGVISNIKISDLEDAAAKGVGVGGKALDKSNLIENTLQFVVNKLPIPESAKGPIKKMMLLFGPLLTGPASIGAYEEILREEGTKAAAHFMEGKCPACSSISLGTGEPGQIGLSTGFANTECPFCGGAGTRDGFLENAPSLPSEVFSKMQQSITENQDAIMEKMQGATEDKDPKSHKIWNEQTGQFEERPEGLAEQGEPQFKANPSGYGEPAGVRGPDGRLIKQNPIARPEGYDPQGYDPQAEEAARKQQQEEAEAKRAEQPYVPTEIPEGLTPEEEALYRGENAFDPNAPQSQGEQERLMQEERARQLAEQVGEYAGQEIGQQGQQGQEPPIQGPGAYRDYKKLDPNYQALAWGKGLYDVGKNLLAQPNRALQTRGVDQPVRGPESFGVTGKIATYGDEYEHPSSITRRIEDPENIDPHQRSDESNDDWAYDMLDVNEIGSTHDPRGKDDAKERIRRQFAASESDSEAIKQFTDFLPLIMEFFHSDESGLDDPIIKSIHEGLESDFPGYLDQAVQDDENQILIMFDTNKNQKESAASGFSVNNTPAQAGPQPQQQIPSMGTNGTCPKCGSDMGPDQMCQQCTPDAARAFTPATRTNITLTPELNITGARMASNTQGPHTDEQQNAFIEHIHEMLEAGQLDEEQVAQLEDMMFNEPSNPEITKIWAEIANQDELFDAAPEDMAPSPQEQMQGMGAPGMPPAPGGDMGMGGPPGPAGPAPGIPDMSAPTPADLNPAGPGAMPPPIMSHVKNDMLKSVLKYAADSAASTCPKCDGHTTGVVNQSTGGCECRSCGHKWDDKNLIPSDGTSTDTSTTSSFHQALNLDDGPMEVMPGSVDSFSEPEELEEDDSSHTWADDSGEPLQEGQEYEIYAHNYEIPDVGRVVEIKPDSIVYEIESNGGLRTTIEIDRKEADLNGYRFVSTDGSSEDNPAGIEENMDSKPVPVPGESTDLSTPHIQIGSSTKVAGKHYTPMEQRELIDEYGEARNADKLNLEGTHYADSDPDYFLFGC